MPWVLALVLVAGGFTAGRLTGAPARAAAVIHERVVAAPPSPARVSCDEAAIAAAVVRSLEEGRAPAAPAPAEPAAGIDPADQDAAARRAEDLLGRARASRRWSAEDAGELHAALRDMSPEQRARALQELSGALNRGELTTDVLPPF